MRTYRVTISNGIRLNRFTMEAESRSMARNVAEKAHIGTGWDVVRVKIKNK